MDEIPCSAIVFRAITRKSWIDKSTERVLPVAFMRRPAPQDDDGLSLNIESAASSTAPFREAFGAASLHAGRLRDLGLGIVVDAAPHANLIGLPRESEDRTAANRLASQLAKQARLVFPS